MTVPSVKYEIEKIFDIVNKKLLICSNLSFFYHLSSKYV